MRDDLDARNAPARLRPALHGGNASRVIVSHFNFDIDNRILTSASKFNLIPNFWLVSKIGPGDSLTSLIKLLSTTQKADAISSVKTSCTRVVWSDVTCGGARRPAARGGFHIGDARSDMLTSASNFNVEANGGFLGRQRKNDPASPNVKTPVRTRVCDEPGFYVTRTEPEPDLNRIYIV